MRAASALLLTLGLSFGLDLNKLQPQGYVSDFAHVLDDSSRARLEAYCGRVEQVTGVQMAIVILDTLDGEPIDVRRKKLGARVALTRFIASGASAKRARTKESCSWLLSGTDAIASKSAMD